MRQHIRPLLEAVRAKDPNKAIEFKSRDIWKLLQTLLDANAPSDTGSKHVSIIITLTFNGYNFLLTVFVFVFCRNKGGNAAFQADNMMSENAKASGRSGLERQFSERRNRGGRLRGSEVAPNARSEASGGGTIESIDITGDNDSSTSNWTCDHCTYINNGELNLCEMCSLPR